MQVSSFPLSAMFGMCTFFLLVCVVCQRHLDSLVHPEKDYQLVDSQPSASLQSVGKGSSTAQVEPSPGHQPPVETVPEHVDILKGPECSEAAPASDS